MQYRRNQNPTAMEDCKWRFSLLPTESFVVIARCQVPHFMTPLSVITNVHHQKFRLGPCSARCVRQRRCGRVRSSWRTERRRGAVPRRARWTRRTSTGGSAIRVRAAGGRRGRERLRAAGWCSTWTAGSRGTAGTRPGATRC